MDLTSLASLDIYDKRLDLRSDSFVLGKDTELWVAKLDNKKKYPQPEAFKINAANVDDTVLNLKLDTTQTTSGVTSMTLYRGDVLWGYNTVYVIDETISVGTSYMDVKVLPLVENVLIDTIAWSYGLIPILSIIDGGGLEFSNTEAEANNRSQGVWSAIKTVNRKATTSVTGSLIVNDKSVELLTELSLGSLNLYCENRYSPYIDFGITPTLSPYGELTTLEQYGAGTGPGAWSFEASVNASISNPGNEFIKVNATLNVSGRPRKYEPLYGPLI